MKQTGSTGIRLRILTEFISIAGVAVFFWWFSGFLNFRIDLTEDRRYTLSAPTREILEDMSDDVYIQVYLEGDMPVQFKKLRRNVSEMLDEFSIVSGRKVDYEFINPSGSDNVKERNDYYKSLIDKGLSPVNIQDRDEEGGSSQKILFPGMIVNCNGIEMPVNFLKNNPSLPPEVNLLHSAEGLEYEMIQTISTIIADTVYKVAFIEGHNEIDENEVQDVTVSLSKYFTVDRGVIGGRPGILDSYSAIIIAGPEKQFEERDKFVIDQYIMNGGRVLWLIEEVNVSADSLVNGETVALYRPLGLEDQLFRYGARVNPSIVQDIECQLIPMKVVTGSQQQIVPVPWLYYPLLYPSDSHPVTRNINRVAGKFVNYLDTVGLDPFIRKKILLSTSSASRTINPPLVISLSEASENPDVNLFRKSSLPVALLLEGTFQSAFKNRPVNNLSAGAKKPFRSLSSETRMIIVSDGDIIRNEIRRIGNEIAPLPLGQDKMTLQLYGNRDFIVNSMNYLVDDNGLMDLRSREIKLRLLDRSAVKDDKLMIVLLNTLLPVFLVVASGILYNYFRKKRYIIN